MRAKCYTKHDKLIKALSDFEKVVEYDKNHQFSESKIEERGQVLLALELVKLDKTGKAQKGEFQTKYSQQIRNTFIPVSCIMQ